MSETPEKPKIIVDDDWKEQVQKEKEALDQQPGGRQDPVGQDPVGQDPVGQASELPPPTFSLLVSSLATQTIAALGQIPDPESKEAPVVRMDVAKHYIDLLDVLEVKTKGNLTQQESEVLTNVLHELRMMYVAIGKQLQ